MPVLVATITPVEGQMDAVESILKDLVPLVHDEEGCELYALHRGRDCFVMVEKWTDGDALRVHGSGPNLQLLNQQLEGLVVGPPGVQVIKAVPAGDAAKGSL